MWISRPVSIKCRLQIGFKTQTRYKKETADCRLGLKCRLRPKLWHHLLGDIFSIYDLYIVNKKTKSWNVIGDNFILTSPVLRPVHYIKTPCEFDEVTVKASVPSQNLRDRFLENVFSMHE